MEYALLIIAGIIVLVATAAFSKKLGVATPILLVVIGIGYSLVPGAPHIGLNPELVLEVLLPLLLYAAAVQVPLMDFRRNLRGITMLSVVLVVVSAVVVGFILYALLPQLDLAAAIALGAVVSPTDAVAATAVAKRLGLPARDVTLLEGESLVNDATALVLLKSAIAATATSVSLWSVAGDFVRSVVVAVVVGLIIGFVTVWVRSKFSDPILETVVTFVVPFLAFIPTEALGASGALSVVVAGLYAGHQSARRLSALSRMSERVNWRVIAFIIENGVFLMMGAELTSLVRESVQHAEIGLGATIAMGLLVVAVLLVVRALVVMPVLYSIRRAAGRADDSRERLSSMQDRIRSIRDRLGDGHRASARVRRAEHTIARRDADMIDLQKNNVGWRDGAVLTWAGMRGVVTLAAAQSLPANTPYRAQLVLIAFIVAIVTLLAQGGTLPWVIRLTKIRGTDAAADLRELASLLDEIADAAEEALNGASIDLPEGVEIDQAVTERLRREINALAESAWEQAAVHEGEAPVGPHAQYRMLLRVTIDAEREALLEARSKGVYPSRVLNRAESLLDQEEARLDQGAGRD
ncbi:cation:proton antiporter [Humibacter albus]|jgi:CPA1 family monovalent cation:H+ antiporter|uniref:cation:proton antiporter n=1 Tax=Humibacter albus TaxID=427754 RepID=UPI0003B73E82|nr:cation:proton antiporter [Humibacter albus]